jgi:hypothetical protein
MTLKLEIYLFTKPGYSTLLSSPRKKHLFPDRRAQGRADEVGVLKGSGFRWDDA